MVILYFTFVGKGKSKADVPIIGGKKRQQTAHCRTGGKGSAFIRPGLCEVTAGMQEVGLMWRLINLYYRPSALSTVLKSSAVVWGSRGFPSRTPGHFCIALRLCVDCTNCVEEFGLINNLWF